MIWNRACSEGPLIFAWRSCSRRLAAGERPRHERRRAARDWVPYCHRVGRGSIPFLWTRSGCILAVSCENDFRDGRRSWKPRAAVRPAVCCHDPIGQFTRGAFREAIEVASVRVCSASGEGRGLGLSVALDRAGITVFRDITFLAAGPASERSRSGLPGHHRSRWRRGTDAAGNLHAEGVAHRSPGSPRSGQPLGDRMGIARTLTGYHNRCADGDGPRDDGGCADARCDAGPRGSGTPSECGLVFVSGTQGGARRGRADPGLWGATALRLADGGHRRGALAIGTSRLVFDD